MSSFTTWVIYFNVVLYATCFQMQRPLEPFLVDKLQSTANGTETVMEYAKLQSFFSIMQTVGSLISGRCLDYFGLKGTFILSFIASALSYYILSQSYTMDYLYYSKIPTIFQSGFLCAQAAIAQFTLDGSERTKALGFLTMSYTVGSIIGPTVGGILGANGDYYFGAKLATAGSLLSVFLTYFFIPNGDVKVEKNDSDSKDVNHKSKVPNILSIVALVWVLLSTKVLSSVANAIQAAVVPIILKDSYGFTERDLGVTMSIASGMNALVNGLLLSLILDWFRNDQRKVIESCLLGMLLLCIVQSLFNLSKDHGTSEKIIFLLTFFLYNIFQFILSTTITGESTSAVPNQAKGTLLGLEHALFALARISSPQIGVVVWQSHGVAGVGVISAVVLAVVWQLFSNFYQKADRGSAGSNHAEEKVIERKEK